MNDKRTILRNCKKLPRPKLFRNVADGVVTLDELGQAGLSDELLASLDKQLRQREQSLKVVGDKLPITHFKELTPYLLDGTLTPKELLALPMSDERKNALNELFTSVEREFRKKTIESASRFNLDDYLIHLYAFPEGPDHIHLEKRIREYEERDWHQATAANTIQAYRDYMESHPGDHHQTEAQRRIEELQDDEDWQLAKQQDFIDALQRYVYTHPRSRHVDEAQKRMKVLREEEQKKRDDEDWLEAQRRGSVVDFQHYVDAHPRGRHVDEAKKQIASADLVKQMRCDHNAFRANKIQEFVVNGKLTWDQVNSIYGPMRGEKIKQFREATSLPISPAPDKLQDDSTEVYFWGLPSSGKTCAMGAIISSAENQGILLKEDCRGYDYMMRLSAIFDSNGICTLPKGTRHENIQEMVMQMKDERKRHHKVTFIDMAGELFRGITLERMLGPARVNVNVRKSMGKMEALLDDDRNKKLHFFIVEYGSHDQIIYDEEYEELNTVRGGEYMYDMVHYLYKKNLLRKSTVGIYILVTKCDKMKCTPKERKAEAERYVKECFRKMWNKFVEIQDAEGYNKEIQVIPFSLGNVFAQSFCEFDDTDTNKVIERLLNKTHARRTGLLGRIIAWLKE